MKKITFLLLVFVALTTSATFAQVAVNENGDSPNSKSILDVQSTTKGMLIPRMTTSERTTLGNTLTVVEKGMLVYDNEQSVFYYFDGSSWNKIAIYGAADSDWTVSGTNMYSAVSGNVGIGKNTNFQGKLDVNGKIYVDNSGGDAMQVYLAGNPTIAPLLWWSSENNGLEINGAEGNGVFVGAADKSGLYVHNAAENGVYIANAAIGLNIDDASTDGIYIKRAGTPLGNASSSYNNGFEVAGAEGNGVYVGYADENGVQVEEAIKNGIQVIKAGAPTSTLASTENNGIEIQGAEGNGVYIGRAYSDGLRVARAGNPNHAAVSSSYNNGLEINATEGHGIFIGKTDMDGIYIHTSEDNGIYVGTAADKGILVNSAATNGLYLQASGEDAIKIYSAGTPSTVHISSANNGIEIMGTEGNGVYVGRADESGVYVESAASAGVEINSVNTGVKINHATHDGVHITKAGTTSSTALPSNDNNGIEVELAEDNGVYIGQADGDGIKIAKVGNPSSTVTNTVNDGIEIQGAEGNGIYIGHANDDGVKIGSTGGAGISISSAGSRGIDIAESTYDGIHISNAGTDGIYIFSADNRGVYANTDNTNLEWGFYTPDKIYGSNLTSKSSSTYGINTGSQSLQAGDVVCIAGGMENNIDGVEGLFAVNLEKADDANRQAVFGVVEYKVNIETNVKENKTSDNQTNRTEDKSFAHSDGDVYSGDYFSVIILGPAEVVVDSKANIKVGANVCIGSNGVASQKVTQVNGITIAENVGILGKSMGEASGGKMLVYVNCK